jgi:hypothetical protein
MLSGGGGSDVLRGAGGDDRLWDDGRTARSRRAGADRLDGGAGVDIVSYEHRTAPVYVNLADRSRDGERNEGDRLTRVESLIGGRGDDRLVGDEHPNLIDGGKGRDTLAGGAGPDELVRAEGRVACGLGRDRFQGGRSPRDFLLPDCEILSPDGLGAVSANPVAVTGRSVRFRVQCPADEDDFGLQRCGPGPLNLREATGKRRTLAQGRMPAGRWAGRLVDARLTPLGQQLARRPAGVPTRISLAGYFPHDDSPLRWTFRLQADSAGR